jgi:UDP-N-acetylmuramoyl-tripeptide--D-alanyl-D-alanine ligase
MAGLVGRGAQTRIAVGDDTALLIDESYNANSASMAATLNVLGATPAARRIAILGEMRELGSESERLHAELAGPVTAAGVDFAILVGEAMAPLASALDGRVEYVHARDATSALEVASAMIAGGDVILVKGSNAVGLGRVVSALIDGRN